MQFMSHYCVFTQAFPFCGAHYYVTREEFNLTEPVSGLESDVEFLEILLAIIYIFISYINIQYIQYMLYCVYYVKYTLLCLKYNNKFLFTEILYNISITFPLVVFGTKTALM